jgi:putative membrane protein
MKRKSKVSAAALAAALGVGAFAYSASGDAQPYGGGWGPMGPGMMGGFGGGYGNGFGMMGGWGGGFLPFHGIFGLLILALIVVAIVWFARAFLARREPVGHTERHSTSLDVLNTRYARGEINREEYLQKRTDVLS